MELLHGEVWNYLTQFFKHNHNFECLKVQCNPRLSTHEFTSSLRRFDSLKEFKLNNIPWDSHKDCQDDVILALTGHTELRKLTFTNVHFGNMFGKNNKSRPCCATLATFLMNPLFNLTKLHLHNTNIDDLGATIIATGLTTNSTLSELIFTCECKITGIGWEAIFAALQSSRCMLAKLVVRDSTFSYAATLWLFAALLRHKTTIKTLSLIDIHIICVAGWEALFQPLRDPTFVLETLCLGCSSLTNEVLFALTSALTNNSRLKELILRENDDSIDLVLFSSVLRNPNSALEMLDLGFHPIDDRTLLSFAEALATNSRLKHLIWFGNTSVTSIGYGALVQLLCNKLSIMDTFLSNHILEEICFGDIEDSIIPEDLVSLLKLNSENTASQAVRLKIIQTHFRGPEINMQPFMDLYLSVKPLAIAWMVRDNNGYPLMRALPSLLEMSSVGKARSKKRPYE